MVKVIKRTLVQGLTGAAVAALLAGPVAAQQNLLPQQQSPKTPQQGAQLTPPANAQQQPAVVTAPPPPPVVLPTLSPAQQKQLADIIAEGRIAQGLRHDFDPTTLPTDSDGLVRVALDYARAVHSGRLEEGDFQEDWGLRPAAYDPLPAFADAVKRDRLRAWSASLPPPYAGYDNLVKGLARYRAIEAKGGWPVLPAGPDLTLGAKGPRVAALRKRLAVEDDQVALTGDFDAGLQDAVRRAQRRYGLNPTGTVSTGTLAALNVPAADRVRQIMANMERWRWLPEQLPKDRIQVNIAAAILTVFDGDQPVMSMKAVTGRPGDETPMLSSNIHSIVLNPPWNVPAGIAAKELLPKGPKYLAAHGFRTIKNPDGSTRLQQDSEHSALGRYKFDFNNRYAVYLHDTPAQAAFSSYSRLESHGCVRLEKPADLAALLLKNQPDWQEDAIQAAVDTGKTQRVSLTVQPQVFLLYWTAFASGNGTMNFRADPYSWDKVLASKIENRSAARAAVAQR